MPLLGPDRSLVKPAYFTPIECSYTLGPVVAELCDRIGFTPDPEQCDALDAIFAYGPDDRPAVDEGGICAARQNIKTGTWKQVALGWLFIVEDLKRAVWTSHEFPTTADSFREMVELIEGADYLMRRVKDIDRGRGAECIETTAGCRLEFRARTKNAGRGLAGPRLILDEALFLKPAHMGSLLPVMSTLSSQPEGAQILYGGSAGKLESDVWRSIRRRGRNADPSLFWLEFCDDLPGTCEQPRCSHDFGVQGCRLDDPARWQRANPQMGRRITEAYIAGERGKLDAAEFARERLGWWEDPAEEGGPFPRGAWAGCLDEASDAGPRIEVAIDVTPERDAAALGAASPRPDGLLHIEVVKHDRGTGWIVPAMRKMRDKWGVRRVWLDMASGASSLIPDLQKIPLEVKAVQTREYAQACGRFFDGVAAESPTVRHIGQHELNLAVSGATTRPLADAIAWDRKDGTDISCLVAVTLAAWGVTRPRGGWMVSVK